METQKFHFLSLFMMLHFTIYRFNCLEFIKIVRSKVQINHIEFHVDIFHNIHDLWVVCGIKTTNLIFRVDLRLKTRLTHISGGRVISR